jgi:hypothetical protein
MKNIIIDHKQTGTSLRFEHNSFLIQKSKFSPLINTSLQRGAALPRDPLNGFNRLPQFVSQVHRVHSVHPVHSVSRITHFPHLFASHLFARFPQISPTF